MSRELPIEYTVVVEQLLRPAVPNDIWNAACRAHGYATDQQGTWAHKMICETAVAIYEERKSNYWPND